MSLINLTQCKTNLYLVPQDMQPIEAHPLHATIYHTLTQDTLIKQPKLEDHWSCIAHLSAEDMLKSVVTEEKKFKHSSWAGADNLLGPNF